MVVHMTAFLSWVFRLIHGDLYASARHRFTRHTPKTSPRVYVGARKGRRYRRPEHRWMDPALLLARVRERDLHTVTRPMRWWEQERDTPDLRYVVEGLAA
jgi:hypothetical protein